MFSSDEAKVRIAKLKAKTRAQDEYVRGLADAAALVSQESARRRKNGEDAAMYALNTAWHAISRLIDEAITPKKQPAKAVK